MSAAALAHSTSGDIWGAIFGLIAIGLAFVLGANRLRPVEHLAYVLSVLVCVIVSTISMMDTSIAIQNLRTDTYDFYMAAQQYYESPELAGSLAVGPPAYAYYLSWLFFFFGPSPYLTNNVGIIAFALSVLVVARVYQDVHGVRASKVPLILFVFSPSVLFFSSLTWREPYQTLFLALALLYGVRYMKSQKLRTFGASFAHLMAGALIHNKIILFNFGFVAWTYLIGLFRSRSVRTFSGGRSNRVFNLLIAPALLVLAFFITYEVALTDTGAVAKVMSQGGAQEALQDWRATHIGRTKFLWDMDFTSPWTMLSSFPVVLLQFLVAPLVPLQLDSTMDVTAALEGAIRVALLLCGVIAFVRASGEQRPVLVYLLGVYLLFAVLLAIGTGNAGSALRHQAKATWILIVVAGPSLFSFLGWRTKRPQQAMSVAPTMPRAALR